ncbi:MAG: ribbon-helix-helix protein, CopG family [Chloroflexi bacterium]|nr:ribbon-helix-helix protein, CopG family [Chloroflexota bacterium]
MKATFELTPELYRAIKVEAARTDRSVKDIVEEALERWLEAAEDAEDIAESKLALEEYERDGGAVEAGEFFAKLAAETKETYGSGAS